ncbi:MAG: hypothetical protein M3Y56_04525 [Armatimonadota bacterium]|nr:hypothetical protein [Armatimonadota bacterium]
MTGIQRTLDQAPAPPLWILAKSSGGSAGWGTNDPIADYGLGGSGYFADGFGSGNDTFSFPGFAPTDQSTLPRRKLIQATLQADQQTTVLLTSPSGHVEISGGQQYATGYPSPRGGGRATGNIYVNQEVHPVLLSSPNPLGHPELGDGTNQYVYDFNTVSGLAIPAWVNVSGASLDDTNWVAPHVGLNTDIADEQAWNWWITAGGLQPNLTNPNVNGVNYSNYDLLFLGLPTSNSNFGNHSVTLKVNGGDSEKANIQDFFPASATNHPVDDADNAFGGVPIPNWYHYYNQVYTATGNYDSSAGPSYTEGIYPYTIHITNQAWDSGSIYPVRVFHFIPNVPGAPYVQEAGQLDCPGIFNYIWTCAHEQGHQNVGFAGTINTKPYNADPDGDHIDDNFEAAHHLNPNDIDTTHAYDYNNNGTRNTEEPGDPEYLADVQTLSILLGSRSLWQQDWADTGVQRSLLPPSIFFSVPDQNRKLDFSFTFHRYVYNEFGTPENDGSSYQVKSLDDLKTKANDPNIITSY